MAHSTVSHASIEPFQSTYNAFHFLASLIKVALKLLPLQALMAKPKYGVVLMVFFFLSIFFHGTESSAEPWLTEEDNEVIVVQSRHELGNGFMINLILSTTQTVPILLQPSLVRKTDARILTTRSGSGSRKLVLFQGTYNLTKVVSSNILIKDFT
jgi:hypothetical protein